MKTGFICDESYFWHDTGNGALFLSPGGWVESDIHSENPATKRRFKNLLERSGLLKQMKSIAPRPATEEEVALFHTKELIQKTKEVSDNGGGETGPLAIVGPGSYEIALLSAGGALTGVDAVMNGDVKNVYALTRPPGHHAEAHEGSGFCLFNNVAIAGKYAKAKYGLKRVLVLDWDVHHGNGTESAFYEDNEVLFISLHQDRYYPADRGFAEHVGKNGAEGYTVNIPLPAGTGNAGYMYAFKEIVAPIVNEFKPELIIVSAGQDPSLFDPLARMMVTRDGFYQFAETMNELAKNHCDGKLVLCHEGGYSGAYVPFCSLAIVESISGISTNIEDPFAPAFPGLPTNELLTSQKEAVDHVKQIQSSYWNLL
ncbi:histone deacetylase [Alkalihalobacillus alcalophilus ATCC 27647 = CGMCC 1.3604]|uniref:Acetoin utilization protein n=1 Tax=Alkalihalobacillus alcalophilus ATCC 27647 = CGMCC 1.3604 TaxID=1218173 RepID=A0A094WRG7_ALKAL|nr:class II histone deacetylase [Alkalihalobacillus alcalophilus]KGA98648.1 acetoin utilization protein [Alkalihalobacillus alcalophilus ATCC 27647 = CGMCC 1.3604]MED1562425.1 class II histone deacetylase [Alkalihalobacillus alcalophilus]THG91161.1 histone deacetylase [Alkalihalobacillus alcalophilus ATCC 27647 = CGMCC 1.3604]